MSRSTRRLVLLALWTALVPGASRAHFHARLSALGLSFGLVGVGLTRWSLQREPLATGVGVELAIAIVMVAMAGLFVGCVAEFSLAERSGFQRWLETLPLPRRRVALLARTPLLALGAAALLALVPPLAVVVRTGTGNGWLASGAVAAAALTSGLVMSPALSLAAQGIVVRLRTSDLLGGVTILLWAAYAAASLLVARGVFDRGAEVAISPASRLLAWPAVLEVALDPSAARWAVAVLVLGCWSAASTFAVSLLRTADVLAASDRVSGQLPLERWGSTGANLARSIRNRRVRAHLLAGVLFVIAVTALRFGRTGAGEPETAAMILALFLATASTATRGLAGDPAVDIVVFTDVATFARSQLLGAMVRALALGTVGGVLLAAASGRWNVVAITVILAVTASMVGALAGAQLVPQPGDSLRELLATIETGVALALLGRLADEVAPGALGYLGVLLVGASVAGVAAVSIETRRWSHHLRPPGQRPRPTTPSASPAPTTHRGDSS